MNRKIKLTSIILTISMALSVLSSFEINAIEVNSETEPSCATGNLSLSEGEISDDVTVIDSVNKYYEVIGSNSQVKCSSFLKSSNSLPASVDNSESEYFPQIASQENIGSCISWAQTYYQFTYAMNKSMGIATTSENTFSPKWTHNFANDGKKDGSLSSDVYNNMIEIGNVPISLVPIDDDYLSWSPYENIWKTAMKYRLADYQRFEPVGYNSSQVTAVNDTDIEAIKTALANGDVLVFSTYVNSFVKSKIKTNSVVPENDKYAGEYVVVRQSGYYGSHQMTLVGYNDNIWTDVNENGVVDSGEMGAFKIANSWGESYCNDGFVWIAYDAVNKTSCVKNAPEDANRGCLLFNITRIDVSEYDSDSSIYLKYTLNTSDRSQGKIYATATKGDEEYTYEIGPKSKSSLRYDACSYDGTSESNDGTMIYALSNVVPGLTSEDLHEYIWSFTFEDTSSDSVALTVKNVEIIDEATGRISTPKNTFPFKLDGNSKTLTFPQIEENSTIIYYRGYENPVLHYKVDNNSWNTLLMENDTSVRGYTHKVSLTDVSSDDKVTIWFSDNNGNIDNNNGKYYTTNSYVNYYVTENARQSLSAEFSDTICDKIEAEKIYNFNADVSGGFEPYQFKYIYENLSTRERLETDYNNSPSDKKSFDDAGKYIVTVIVKDFADETVKITKNITVENHSFEFSEFSVEPNFAIKVGGKLNFTAITNYEHIKTGSNQFNEYAITVQKNGVPCYNAVIISSSYDIENMTSTINFSWVPEESGEYIASISSTDANKEYNFASVSFIVKNNLLGDVNRDTYITITDVTQIQKYLSDTIDISDIWEIAADVDKNGFINIKDATYIQKYLSDADECANVGEIIKVKSDEVDPPLTVPTTVSTTSGGNYVYYKNTNNWSVVKAYYWSATDNSMVSWPGVAMTNVGNNVYSIKIPAEAQYIIFNNGSSQTEDILLCGANKIYINGSWSDYSVTEKTDPTEGTTVADKNYLYYYNSSGWSSVNAYYWSDSNTTMTVWPGKAMTSVGNNIFRIEVPSDAAYIIFNNGSSKTDDLLIQSMNMIYKNGLWSSYL